MLKLPALASIAFALSAPFASAQVAIIGGGIAKDCYEAAKYQRVSASSGEKICTRALEAEIMNVTNKAATYTNRGVLRMRSGRLEAALSDYDIAKQMRPEEGATYLNEGAAHILRKDFNSALVSLNKAIELNSHDLYAAYYNRAIAKENTGDIQGAYFDFKQADELNPESDLAKAQMARFQVTTN
jgi:tetratricopeptide (TPR) repeat protein